MNELPVLYSFRRCPYAMRARLAIAASGQQCELREVVLRDKPAALLQASPKGTVPVLVLPDGAVLEQSLDIMHWALARNDPQHWLHADPAQARAMQALVAECDGAFKQALDRTKYPQRYPGEDPTLPRQRAEDWLAGLEQRLAAGGFLFGPQARWADMAILPFVRQYAGIDTERWQAQPWPHLRYWLAQWQDSALFAQVMRKAPAWAEGGPGVPFPP